MPKRIIDTGHGPRITIEDMRGFGFVDEVTVEHVPGVIDAAHAIILSDLSQQSGMPQHLVRNEEVDDARPAGSDP